MLKIKKTVVGLVCWGMIELKTPETKKPESHLALKSQRLLFSWYPAQDVGLLLTHHLPWVNNGILIGKTRGCGWWVKSSQISTHAHLLFVAGLYSQKGQRWTVRVMGKAGSDLRGKRGMKQRSKRSGWAGRCVLLLRYGFLVLVALNLKDHRSSWFGKVVSQVDRALDSMCINYLLHSSIPLSTHSFIQLMLSEHLIFKIKLCVNL